MRLVKQVFSYECPRLYLARLHTSVCLARMTPLRDAAFILRPWLERLPPSQHFTMHVFPTHSLYIVDRAETAKSQHIYRYDNVNWDWQVACLKLTTFA